MKNTLQLKMFVFGISSVLLLIPKAYAQVTWDGGAPGTDVDNALNWTTDTLPTIINGLTGTIESSVTDNITINSLDLIGYQVTQEGGTFGSGANKRLDGGYWTLESGGVMDFDARLILTNAHILTLNGGTISVDEFRTLDAGSTAVVGGSSAGTFSINSFGTFNGSIDWQSGSLFEMTVTGFTQTDYQNLYSSGDLLFEGANSDPFGDNFSVSGNNLTLIPEPSSIALLGLAGVVAVFLNRRRK